MHMCSPTMNESIGEAGLKEWTRMVVEAAAVVVAARESERYSQLPRTCWRSPLSYSSQDVLPNGGGALTASHEAWQTSLRSLFV